MLFGSARIQPQAHSFIVRMHYIIPQPFPSHPGHAPIHHEWQAMSGMTGYQFPHITGQEGGVAAPNLPTQMGAGPRWFDGTSWIKIIHAKGVTMTLLGQPRGGGAQTVSNPPIPLSLLFQIKPCDRRWKGRHMGHLGSPRGPEECSVPGRRLGVA